MKRVDPINPSAAAISLTILAPQLGERRGPLLSQRPELRRRAQLEALTDAGWRGEDAFTEIDFGQNLGFVSARFDDRGFAGKGGDVEAAVGGDDDFIRNWRGHALTGALRSARGGKRRAPINRTGEIPSRLSGR